jgi:ribosomal protein S18 acetylase RimI-like enzyme
VNPKISPDKTMSVEISPVKTSYEIDMISTLARETWTRHYTPIIGAAQVEYMLNRFQSSPAIDAQISDGYEYYLAKYQNKYVGYTALVPDDENHKMMISKIYTLAEARGEGVGSQLLSFIEDKCNKQNISRLWLTVNKNNSSAIAWYRRRGFNIKQEIKVDIGNGFYMDDYVMEKTVSRDIEQ